VDVDDPTCDQPWDDSEGSESEFERLDRHWARLLQELRVVQARKQSLHGHWGDQAQASIRSHTGNPAVVATTAAVRCAACYRRN
jgi:hypothetical protein